ncbi:MAG: D-alanine--D-alanine ligase [Candidatus Omnitrophota bacterium]
MKLDGSKRVGVLMGGPSRERDISITSGRAVAAALRSRGVEAVEILINTEEDFISLIRKASIDIAFIAMHGCFGEDGTMQKILEGLNIPYTGSGPLASSLAMDKISSRHIFEQHDILTPPGNDFNNEMWQNKLTMRNLAFPLVVKPATEGSSIGLSIVWGIENIERAVEHAFRFSERIIIEKYIKGREITVGILGGRVLPVIQIIPKNSVYDYEAKYSYGKTSYLLPAPLPPVVYKQAQDLACRAHDLLGCDAFSRVDMIVEDLTDKVFVLEVNTIPGLTKTSLLPKAAAFAGIDFAELCLEMILFSERGIKKLRYPATSCRVS